MTFQEKGKCWLSLTAQGLPCSIGGMSLSIPSAVPVDYGCNWTLFVVKYMKSADVFNHGTMLSS